MIEKGKFWVKVKKNWKNILIGILICLFVSSSFSYSQLSQEYNDYQQKIKDYAYELELNLTRSYANMDCYERGTVECYEGKVFCYDEPKITPSCEEGYNLGCIKD